MALALAAGVPAARAAVVPTLVSAGGSAGHQPGSPGGASFGATLSAPASTSPGFDSDFNPHTISFPSGSGTGSTTAKVGISHTESLNVAKVLFARGTGVSQTDPGHAQSASTLEFQFGATWQITSDGNFGPPITTSFNVPLGMKIGAGGSATFFCDVHWDASFGTVTPTTDVRAPYTTTQTFGPGTQLTSFNAPASPFLFSSLNVGDTVIMRGTIRFTANNDDAPTLIEIPTLEDFPEFAGRPELTAEAGMAVGDVPEPTTVAPLAIAAVLGLARRRRAAGRATATGVPTARSATSS